jgi:hypothetical protein
MGHAQSGVGRLRVLRRDGQAAATRLRARALPGGRYTLDNIVPVCRSCNTSKCNDEVTGWLRRKRLDERAFLLCHMEISTRSPCGSKPSLDPLSAAQQPIWPGSPVVVDLVCAAACRPRQCPRHASTASSTGAYRLSVGGSAEVRDCFLTHAVTGTWTSRRR